MQTLLLLPHKKMKKKKEKNLNPKHSTNNPKHEYYVPFHMASN